MTHPTHNTQAEPTRVYIVATGETHDGHETYTRHDVPPPLCDAEMLYAAPPADKDPTSKDQYRRMFVAACEALGVINESLGLDPEDGGAEPILGAIEEMRVALGLSNGILGCIGAQPPAADVAGLVAELGRLLAKITAPEGNYTASDRTEFTMQMLNGINKLAALAQPKQPITYHRDDTGPEATDAYIQLCARLDTAGQAKLANLVAHGAKATLAVDGGVILSRADWDHVLFLRPEQPKQPARVELPPLSDAEYRRGYRDGYNRRDDEVKGALA